MLVQALFVGALIILFNVGILFIVLIELLLLLELSLLSFVLALLLLIYVLIVLELFCNNILNNFKTSILTSNNEILRTYSDISKKLFLNKFSKAVVFSFIFIFFPEK